MKQDNSKHETDLIDMALTEYFSTRYPLPGTSADTLTELVREDKSTEEIVDDLSPMITLTLEEVNDFLFFRDYKMAHQPDGTLKWAIWRDFSVGAMSE